MRSVETAPLLKAVVVGKGADFANYEGNDGEPAMSQVRRAYGDIFGLFLAYLWRTFGILLARSARDDDAVLMMRVYWDCGGCGACLGPSWAST
jgi:hypothetical protein